MTEPDAGALPAFHAPESMPPVPLPSIEQLQELLPWSQGALDARLSAPAEDWKGLACQAARLLPFLWAGYPGDPFRRFDDNSKGHDPLLASLFIPEETGRHFAAHASRAGPEAAATAVILADVAEALDLTSISGPVLLDETLDAVARGDIDLRARTEELVAAVRSGTEPPAAAPGLPDPIILAHLLRHLHPPGPDRQAPLWPQVIHQARSIALFDRHVPRKDWQDARTQLGRHGAATAAIVAMAKQSLELVSDPAASLRGTVAKALNAPSTLGRSARKLVKATARLALLPDPGSLDVPTPSLESARQLYRRVASRPPAGPDIGQCSWHNLYDRMVRIHLPARLGRGADLSEAKELLGQRAFTTVAILALSRYTYSHRHYGLAELCFATAIRMAGAGALDLDDIAGRKDEDSPETDAVADSLKPVPDIHDIRGLIPDTHWVPVSDEPGQQYGWASVIENARRLGRDALDIDDGTWDRLKDRIEARGAAAAILYAAPRQHLAPEPRVIDRIAGMKSRYGSGWYSSILAQAVDAIESEIDLAILAALEGSEFQPEAPELLPDADVVKEHGPRSIRGLFQGGSHPDWEELTAAAQGLATERLGLSEDDWRRACRILGPRRAAAAALAAAAFEEQRTREDFGKIVFHEATHPESLASVLRSKYIPHFLSRDAFALSEPASTEPAL